MDALIIAAIISLAITVGLGITYAILDERDDNALMKDLNWNPRAIPSILREHDKRKVIMKKIGICTILFLIISIILFVLSFLFET